MNPRKVFDFAKNEIKKSQDFYTKYAGGEYSMVLDNESIAINAYPQSFGRIYLSIRTKYAYHTCVVTRYAQVEKAVQEAISKSFDNFYRQFYFRHRKEVKK